MAPPRSLPLIFVASEAAGGDAGPMAAVESRIQFLPEDLAPGDARARELDPAGFEVTRIASSTDPAFALAYDRLWTEFGAAHEMEGRDIIERRMAWQPAARVEDCWLRYELVLVRKQG